MIDRGTATSRDPKQKHHRGDRSPGEETIMKLTSAVVASVLSVLPAPATHAQVVAYRVAAGTFGNQDAFGSALGMDFNVNAPITVTQLGVFDSGSDGLAHLLTAQ